MHQGLEPTGGIQPSPERPQVPRCHTQVYTVKFSLTIWQPCFACARMFTEVSKRSRGKQRPHTHMYVCISIYIYICMYMSIHQQILAEGPILLLSHERFEKHDLGAHNSFFIATWQHDAPGRGNARNYSMKGSRKLLHEGSRNACCVWPRELGCG